MLTLLAGERVLALLAREKWEMRNGSGAMVGRQVGRGDKRETVKNGK